MRCDPRLMTRERYEKRIGAGAGAGSIKLSSGIDIVCLY